MKCLTPFLSQDQQQETAADPGLVDEAVGGQNHGD